MDEATIVAAFAQKLKSLRLLNGLTLDELGRLSNVSISTISKIENGQQRPSFETVLRIARVLKINFVQLLEPARPAEAQSSNLARRIVTRGPDAPIYASQWYSYHTHSAELTRKAMIPFLMQIKTRELPPLDEWSIHDGEEFIFVIEGVLEFHTEHYAPALLNKGDSCYLDSTMRHAFVSKGEADAMILSVCRSVVPFTDASGNPVTPTSNAS